MNIEQEKIDNLNSVINIKINPEDYLSKVEKAIKDQAKKTKLPGFRPGMVPAAHIKKMYGKSILVEEVNNLLSDTLNNYLTENKIEILGQPLPKLDPNKEFNWDFNDEFEFNYELGLAPQFEIDFASTDELPHYNIKIDEETLAARMKNIRRSYGKMTNPDVSADGDVLFSELVQLAADGSIFEEGYKNEKASVRIDLIKDDKIKKSLVGLKKEDVVEFDIQKAFDDPSQIARILTIEEEDAKELKSKFRLTVKNINRLGEADFNQEFFDKLFGEDVIKTEEEFKAEIIKEQESMMAQNAEQRLQNDLYEFIMKKVDLTFPDQFLKRWLQSSNEKLSSEELEEGYADFANSLKWNLIENKIIKNNSIEIKYEDVFQAAKQKLDAQFRMYSPQPIPEEQLGQYTVQYLQNKENANKVFEEVKAIKVLQHLKTIVKLKEEPIEYNKFLELK